MVEVVYASETRSRQAECRRRSGVRLQWEYAISSRPGRRRGRRRLALVLRRVNVVTLRLFLFLRWWPDACGKHHLFNRCDRTRRRLEVAESVSAGNRQRRPSKFVARVPDVDPCALGREELHGTRKVLVCRRVHGGFAVIV